MGVTCNAMKNILYILFCFFGIVSCNENDKNSNIKETNPILIKIGYYPSFHQPAETILNLNEKYLLFYSPTSYNPPPPPPPRKNGNLSIQEKNEYTKYLNENPELKPFKSNLSEIDIKKVNDIVNSFQVSDFNDKNLKPALDGMSTNIIILYSDGKIVQINPMNVPNAKQSQLYTEILSIVSEKNTDKNNLIIIQKIQNYN